MNHECRLSAIVPRRAPSCEPNHQVGNIAASEPDVSACISRLLLLHFYQKGKGSQTRVWYNVADGTLIVFLENASIWFVLAKLQKDPFVSIHGMSYPRGDTFLIPATPRMYT